MNTQERTIPSDGFVYLLVVLARWKRFIVITVMLVTAAAAGVSFLLPKWYSSAASVVPVKNQNVLSGLGNASSSLLRQLTPLRSLGSLGQVTDVYSFLAVLKSRPLLEEVVNRFDLIAVYEAKDRSMLEAIAELRLNIDFRVNEEGTLQIEVMDRDPVRAAAMANFFADVLDRHNRELMVREAHYNREFLERRLEQNVRDLAQARAELEQYQREHGLVGVTEENNPLFREYASQQRLFERLMPLLEQMKVEEQRTTPTLLVLEPAVVPELASHPKKRLIVVVFFLLSLFVSMAVAFFADRVRRMQETHPADFERLARGWLRIFLRKDRRQAEDRL